MKLYESIGTLRLISVILRRRAVWGQLNLLDLAFQSLRWNTFFRSIRIRNTGTYFEEITTKCRITMTFVVYYKTELNTSDMSDFVHPSSHVQVFFLFESFKVNNVFMEFTFVCNDNLFLYICITTIFPKSNTFVLMKYGL